MSDETLRGALGKAIEALDDLGNSEFWEKPKRPMSNIRGYAIQTAMYLRSVLATHPAPNPGTSEGLRERIEALEAWSLSQTEEGCMITGPAIPQVWVKRDEVLAALASSGDALREAFVAGARWSAMPRVREAVGSHARAEAARRYPDRQPEAGVMMHSAIREARERGQRDGFKVSDADPPQEPARYVKPAAQVTHVCKGCDMTFDHDPHTNAHFVNGMKCGSIEPVVPAQEKQS